MGAEACSWSSLGLSSVTPAHARQEHSAPLAQLWRTYPPAALPGDQGESGHVSSPKEGPGAVCSWVDLGFFVSSALRCFIFLNLILLEFWLILLIRVTVTVFYNLIGSDQRGHLLLTLNFPPSFYFENRQTCREVRRTVNTLHQDSPTVNVFFSEPFKEMLHLHLLKTGHPPA